MQRFTMTKKPMAALVIGSIVYLLGGGLLEIFLFVAATLWLENKHIDKVNRGW